MVFEALKTRLSALRGTGGTEPTSATDSARSGSRADPDSEMLSYAEQVEYGVDERDLPDEDKVLRLLVKRGGRVDRDTVLEHTGWSTDRLDQVVDRMESDDQVSALTVGRKRVICRRGFEPKGYRSHLSE